MLPLESLISQNLGLMIIIIVVFAALVIIIWYLDTHSNNPVFCIDEKDEHEYAISNSAESIYNVLMNREQVTFVNRPRFFSYLDKNMEFHIGSHVIKMISRNEYEDELGNHWSLHKDYYSKWWVAQHKNILTHINRLVNYIQIPLGGAVVLWSTVIVIAGLLYKNHHQDLVGGVLMMIMSFIHPPGWAAA